MVMFTAQMHSKFVSCNYIIWIQGKRGVKEQGWPVYHLKADQHPSQSSLRRMKAYTRHLTIIPQTRVNY